MKPFWLALVPAILTAQVVPSGPATPAQSSRSDSGSAPIRDVRYDVTFTRVNAQYRVVDVAMTFMTAGTSNVILSLPAWTPGAYEISNYARWVGAFEVTGDGTPL